jgi:hypothetical protein
VAQPIIPPDLRKKPRSPVNSYVGDLEVRTRQDKSHAAVLGVLVAAFFVIPWIVQIAIYVFRLIFPGR